MKEIVLFFTLFLHFIGNAQSVNHKAQLTTGYNRIGFYNEVSYKFGVKKHELKFGARHYTFDNFFEKNTIGLSIDYLNKFYSKNEKLFFYPGVSFSIFKEQKSNAKVTLTDYKVITGLGYTFYRGMSLYYQLGFGILDTRAQLKVVDELVKINYFNYEMAIGISYRFGTASK